MLGPKGVPYTQGAGVDALQRGDYALTRELLRCADCGVQSLLSAAEAAAGIPEDSVYWEMTETGIRVPLKCPDCSNTTHFVRDVRQLVATQQTVTVTEERRLDTHDDGGAPQVIETVVVRYVCGEQDCAGVILICSEDYVLTRGT